MKKMVSQGLSWDEARRASYPEMLVLTAHADYDAAVEAHNKLLLAVQTSPFTESKDRDKTIATLTRDMNRISQEFNDPFNYASLKHQKERLERAKREARDGS